MLIGYMLLFMALGLVVYLGPAIGLLYLGFGRKVRMTMPRCAKCDYDLRTCWDKEMCPECGANIQQAGAVHYNTAHKRRLPLILGLLWLAAPMVMQIVGASIAMNVGTQAIPRKSTSVLISDLGKGGSAGEPWIWQELERRDKAKRLSGEEIDQCIKALIAHLKTKTANQRGPLHWSGSCVYNLIQNDRISQPVLDELLEVYFGAPSIFRTSNVSNRLPWYGIDIKFANSWFLGESDLEPSCYVTGVSTLAQPGKMLLFRPEDRYADKTWVDDSPVPISAGGLSEVYIQKSLPAGEHRLVLQFVCRYNRSAKSTSTSTEPLAILNYTVHLDVTIDERGDMTITNSKQIQDTPDTTTSPNAPQPQKP